MDGHLDIALAADGHEPLKEILEVLPELLLGHIPVFFKQLVQLGHALRLPAGEGHMIFLRKGHDVIGHLLGVVLDHALLIVQRRRAVAHRVEEIRACPVEDGHKVVADDLHAEGGEVTDCLDVVVDVLIARWQADFDIIVDIDRLYHVGVEACGPDLSDRLFDLLLLPDLARHLVV